MKKILRLSNSIKMYDWGSETLIPSLLDLPNVEKKPFAEVWMGAHSGGPSMALVEDGKVPLTELIEGNPEQTVGEKCSRAFGKRLPFLFKVLAAERPLSIQAHPDKAQAEAGWRKENDKGIPLDAATRNYKDDNHKPEILCALTPFRALCGFRRPEEIRFFLDALGAPALIEARNALNSTKEQNSLRDFFTVFSTLTSGQKRDIIEHTCARLDPLQKSDPLHSRTWELVSRLARTAGTDAAILSPLFLNDIELQSGQAIYVPAGILHAYIRGMGVELMASSDNVLRGGLTPKHIDVEELMRVLRFESYRPPFLTAIPSSLDGLSFYDAPAGEFRLFECSSLIEGKAHTLPSSTPSIVIATEGSFEIRCGGEQAVRICKGESVFIAASAPNPTISGKGTAYIASVPL